MFGSAYLCSSACLLQSNILFNLSRSSVYLTCFFGGPPIVFLAGEYLTYIIV